MIVWLVAIRSNSGLSATAHASAKAARDYVRYRYAIPAHVAASDILGWVGANSDDEVLIDYDDMHQEPR